MTPEFAIQLALMLPLVAVGGTLLFSARPNLREGQAVLCGLALFAIVVYLTKEVYWGGRPAFSLFEFVPGLSIAFKVEPLGALFALVASSLWSVTTIYAAGYMRGHHEKNQTRFFCFFSAAIFAAIGAAFAGNMLTLFFFYELMTLLTYPLVTHHGTKEAMRGGRIYFGILIFGSIAFMLLAILWTYHLTGTLDFEPGGILKGSASRGVLVALLMLYIFGTGKAALMPFHRWLPAAMVAPTPVSALLHAVAVVKVGVFTVLKVTLYIFGIDLLHEQGLSTILMYVAGYTMLAASLIAMTKDNLKERLAYSTVSQLSYIVLGAMLANDLGIMGASLHIAMHAFGKITLFFCAGAFIVAAHKTEISDMRGLGRRMPITMAAFFVGAIAVIGLPPCGGAWSKWYLALATAEAEQWALLAALMISSLLNIAYLMPIPVWGFFAPDPQTPPGEKTKIVEAPVACLMALVTTAVMSVALFFLAGKIELLLAPLRMLGGGS